MSFFDMLVLAHLTSILVVPEMLSIARFLERSTLGSPWNRLKRFINLIPSALDLFLHCNLAVLVEQAEQSLNQCLPPQDLQSAFNSWDRLRGSIYLFIDIDLIVLGLLVLRSWSNCDQLQVKGPGTSGHILNSVRGWFLVVFLVVSLELDLRDIRSARVTEYQGLGFGQLLQLLSIATLSIQLWGHAIEMVHDETNTEIPRYKSWIANCSDPVLSF